MSQQNPDRLIGTLALKVLKVEKPALKIILRWKKEWGSSLLTNKMCVCLVFEFLGEGNGMTQKELKNIHTQYFTEIYKNTTKELCHVRNMFMIECVSSKGNIANLNFTNYFQFPIPRSSNHLTQTLFYFHCPNLFTFVENLINLVNFLQRYFYIFCISMNIAYLS